VFNIDGGATGGFMVSGVDKNGDPITASAIFLFATEDGTLVGWNPAVNPQGFDPTKAGTYATITVDNSGNNFTEPDPLKQTGTIYKGLSIASSLNPISADDPSSTTVLYAANFRFGKIEVYDANFKLVTLPTGAFSDPKLPKDYAPFNVQILDDKMYVTYAQQDAAKHDDVGGHGHVKDPDGEPIDIDHLWALKVGNGGAGGDANTVYFTAGIDNEMHGLFGSLTPVAPGTPEGPADAEAVVAALDVVQLDLAKLDSDINSGTSSSTIAQDTQILKTDFGALQLAEQQFVQDSGHEHGMAARQDIGQLFAADWSYDL
jgi:hypothetical protein